MTAIFQSYEQDYKKMIKEVEKLLHQVN